MGTAPCAAVATNDREWPEVVPGIGRILKKGSLTRGSWALEQLTREVLTAPCLTEFKKCFDSSVGHMVCDSWSVLCRTRSWSLWLPSNSEHCYSACPTVRRDVGCGNNTMVKPEK